MTRVSLSLRTRAWINAVGLGLWISGLGWLVSHYFIGPRDALSPAPNPLEPWWLRVHGAFAYLAVWTLGLLWGMHIFRAWGKQRRRWTGSMLFSALALLAITGYLLYYVASDSARAIISPLHWLLGIALLLAYVTHRLSERVRRKRHERLHDAHP